MGIELPPELAGVAAQAGVSWPQADEDAMARSAQSWRDAATSMSTVTTDADTTVRGGLDAVRGDTGTAATQHWQTFVEPDSGHLTSTVRGMNAAADRLEHAADQVGTAKVEIVRNLVSLAQNSDAAHSAAAAGHPTALAGLDTAIRGTSANVANIESSLVTAVQPASGVDMAGVRDPVNANPGTHGPGPVPGVTNLVAETTGAGGPNLLGGATELVGATTHGATNLVADTTQGATNLVTDSGPGHGGAHPLADTVRGATNLVGDTTQGATNLVTDTGHGGANPLADTVRGTTNLVGDTTQGATNLVGDTARGATDLVADTGPGHGGAHPLADTAHGATHLVGDTAQGATNLVGDAAPGPGHGGAIPVSDTVRGATDVVGDTGHGAANLVGDAAQPGPGHLPGDPLRGGVGGDPEITGPVPIGDSWSPGLGDQPTPPTGQTVQAGFADGPAAAPAANLPPGAPPVGGVPAPVANPGAPAVPGGPAFGGAPGIPAPGPVGGPVAGGPAPGAPGGAAPGAGAARQGFGAPPAGGAPVGGAMPARPVPGSLPAGPMRPDVPLPEPRRGAFGPAMAAAPAAPAAHPSAPPAAPPKERDEALAMFWVHMFPIGHIPVAADRPARQLPPPPAELDYAAGLRFEPGDHPRSDLVDSAGRRAALRDGVARLEPSDALPADSPEVTELAAGHDPLGGDNERDWDRRYLVRFGSVTAQGISRDGVEFAWPPGEQYPEGGSADGEAEVLDEGAELDRFGRWDGRIFAEAGTPFAQRSLPPAHLELGYRRYRVLRPLPVWRAVSAAWFAQSGGGIRYRTTHSALELVAFGYLADITREPNTETTP